MPSGSCENLECSYLNGGYTLNLNQLYCFRVLAQSEHLSKTAEELNYSVPALSVIISRLENELGVKLFNRVGRNIQLNENGALFLQYVNQSLNALEEGIKRLSEQENSTSEIIRIGTFAHQYWLDYFNSFLSEHPGMSISRTKISLSLLENEACISQYDFIIAPESDFHYTSWNSAVLIRNESPMAVFSPQCQLPQKTKLSLSDLTNEKIVVLSKQESLRRYFDELCKRKNIRYKRIIETDILFRNKLMYGRENYIAFTSDLALSMGLLPNLRAMPIETDMPSRVINIYWRKNRYLTKNMLCLLESIQEYSRAFDLKYLHP